MPHASLPEDTPINSQLEQPVPAPPAASPSPLVALVGNPNTGKSALFNRLTGSRQRVGNYPGLTIEKRAGVLKLGDRAVDVVDLPGLYSMAALSADERVVLDVMSGHMTGTRRPDVVVCVLDATNLRRNLYLATQVAEAGIPVVLVLNMWDEAEEQGLKIDHEAMSARLGVPVVTTVASKGVGTDAVREAIDRALTDKALMPQIDWPKPVHDATAKLREGLDEATNQQLTDAEVRRLLFDVDSAVEDEIGLPAEQWRDHVRDVRDALQTAGYDASHVETSVRFGWLDMTLDGLLAGEEAGKRRRSESIDNLLTHRVFGLLIFVGVMYVVFQSIYTLAGPFMDGIDALFGMLGESVGGMLEGMPILQSLVVDGVIAGVGGVLIFLPQIVILFLFIALLEDAGYMPRAAFLMDRLFGWCGLSGKSFVPLLSSYACAVPGVMAARTIHEPKARLTTILVCPLMSCSARLPVYVLLIGAFIEPMYGAAWAGFTLFIMHFVGLAVAIPASFIFNRLLLRGRRTPFVLEMPPYRVPALRDVTWRVYSRAKEFVVRAGTVIFAMAIIIWAMCYFPRPQDVADSIQQQHVAAVAAERQVDEARAEAIIEADEELTTTLEQDTEAAYLEQSIMGRFGKAVQPAFEPAGFDWKITVGVLASFPAREVIISTLGILYQLGTDVDEESAGLASAMEKAKHADGTPVFTPVVAVAIMVFFALCSQCMATLVAVARESNWKWATFSFVYMTSLAWLGAVLVYQVGTAMFPA